MHIHPGALFFLATLLTLTPEAVGQTPAKSSHHEVDLAIMYSAQRNGLTDSTNFWRQGGTAELSAYIVRGLGAVMSIGGSRVSNINGTDVNLTTITTIFGPRYTWTSSSSKIALFGQGLIGQSHGLDGVFPSPQGVQTNFDAFALQLGGGLDLRVKRRIALRPIQAEWLRTQYPNGGANVQNEMKLSAGIVVRLQR